MSNAFDAPLETPEEPDVSMPTEIELADAQDEDSYVYDMDEEEEEYGDLASIPFDGNLADVMPDEELTEIASECLEMFDADLLSRQDWEKSYIDGLEYLGMKAEDRNDPWPGACGVFHPLLTEAVVRFQSQAIMEVFPAAGPVRTKIVGKEAQEKTERAARMEEEMNFIITERMPEYRGETEQLLFRLPLSGSCFRKIYPDPMEPRPVALMVPAEDFVISYGATDLKSCERYTHRMRRSENEVNKLIASGFYSDIDLPEPTPEYNDTSEAHDKITGTRPTVQHDTRHTILEMHCDYDFGEDEKIALPYIITIEKSSQQVLSIRRNWLETDQARKKRIHFAHYQYMPGMGFYGTGLVHMIGGLAKSATSVLRQLVDAGTLANLTAGFKTRGLRIKNEDEPLAPGEFRDVDVGSGTIRDAIYALPTKEPSPTLYQLLGTIVDEGRRIASIADLEIGEMSANSPVGTTLALLERSMKIMSAVHARLHAAFKTELQLIAKIVADMPPQYEWDEDQEFNRQEDFKKGKVDILPVSDPNSSTMAQRVVQFQAVMQMATGSPDLYNMPLLHRKGLEALQVKDAESLVPMQEEIQPRDPIVENMGFITGIPTKVFQHQDHTSHIQAHISFAMDPQIAEMVGQSPKAAIVQGAIEAHVAEHLAYQYRQQIEKEMGVKLPPPTEPLPPEIENKLAGLVADAANRLLYRHQNEKAVQQAEETAKDPIIQLQMRELQLKEREFQHKQQTDWFALQDKADTADKKIALDTIKAGIQMTVEEKKLNQQMDKEASKTATDLAKIAGNIASAEISSRNRGSNGQGN